MLCHEGEVDKLLGEQAEGDDVDDDDVDDVLPVLL